MPTEVPETVIITHPEYDFLQIKTVIAHVPESWYQSCTPFPFGAAVSTVRLRTYKGTYKYETCVFILDRLGEQEMMTQVMEFYLSADSLGQGMQDHLSTVTKVANQS